MLSISLCLLQNHPSLSQTPSKPKFCFSPSCKFHFLLKISRSTLAWNTYCCLFFHCTQQGGSSETHHSCLVPGLDKPLNSATFSAYDCTIILIFQMRQSVLVSFPSLWQNTWDNQLKRKNFLLTHSFGDSIHCHLTLRFCVWSGTVHHSGSVCRKICSCHGTWEANREKGRV
jgi:hypothetical protein